MLVCMAECSIGISVFIAFKVMLLFLVYYEICFTEKRGIIVSMFIWNFFIGDNQFCVLYEMFLLDVTKTLAFVGRQALDEAVWQHGEAEVPSRERPGHEDCAADE